MILPVLISDGRFLHEFTHAIPRFDCRRFMIPVSAFEKTPIYIEFRDQMSDWIREVANAISMAPVWMPTLLLQTVALIPRAPIPDFPLPVMS